ncbi:UDP-glucuronate 4-epimerase 3-like [Dendrobium catenatum]|uniref:UDP-glucuronate 4-epimerase n=1 Tax=Dendrobium catenatum TaxID=906689 RepID=A0A2I0WBQ3_9ASPA|nr:UDP-glucuronate 4-epimerase 3-like [Dendrobium catenatum]XP_028553355.1 UDP-glucuronate 4-epimerase 3-like [Dendrobium catenatum]XP_028553356.1 UDP-glucuronate 4-epimerase 3-like [Dendrobium catenatum]PKU73083.1 UDP-glucuronate 4-epimerase 3 [Dendrobium catenatum]
MDVDIPSSPGKFKSEKPHHHYLRLLLRWHYSSLHKFLCWTIVAAIVLFVLFLASPNLSSSSPASLHSSSITERRSLRTSSSSPAWGDPAWEKRVRDSARIRRRPFGISVLVTGAAGFIGSHATNALKRRGDGVVGLDNFNDYYDPSLKRARQALLSHSGVFVVEGDINDGPLLRKLFDLVAFTHVLHLAAQAGVRYAMKNPGSYIHSNVAGLVSVLEAARSANPQPAIVWASSSSVYGLNTEVPFSESHRTDSPASLYAATKKAGEEIAHVYNHIYGLSITSLRFFTVYGPWGRPDMACFFFTRDILAGKTISIFQGPDDATVARDFTYIDDIVQGSLASLDTAQKSTGSGGTKQGPAQLRVFNLGNTSPVSVVELVSILERHLKVKAKRKFVKMPRNGDVLFTHANVSLAKKELGYHPNTNLQTGLKRFVKWYLEYYAPPSGSYLTKKGRGGGSSSS